MTASAGSRHRLLDRRYFQGNTEECRHCPVAEKGLVVEDQILELAPFG